MDPIVDRLDRIDSEGERRDATADALSDLDSTIQTCRKAYVGLDGAAEEEVLTAGDAITLRNVQQDIQEVLDRLKDSREAVGDYQEEEFGDAD